jgi:hypothetical protein
MLAQVTSRPTAAQRLCDRAVNLVRIQEMRWLNGGDRSDG